MLALTIPAPAVENVALFLLVGSLSAAIFGLGKVGFGGGVGILSVPLMVMACGEKTFLATGIMLPLLIVADYAGVVSWWKRWQWRSIAPLLPGVVVGVAAGAVVLWRLRLLDRKAHDTVGSAILQAVIGLIALGFVVLEILRRRSGKVYTFRPVFWQATVAGTLIGVSSTLAHAAGPIATMYLLSQRMEKERFVASTVLLFWLVNQIKLVPYIALDMIDGKSLAMGLYLIPAVIIGAVAGRLLIRRIGPKSFTGVIYALLAVAGAQLLYKAAMLLLG